MPEPASFHMGANVYAERDGKILLLKRAGGALSGQWYIPGGMVDAGEVPEQAAVRELWEEAGLEPAGPLELIGLFPMHLYGHDALLASYACPVTDGEVVISAEHDGAQWVAPSDMRAVMSDELLDTISGGDERIGAALRAIRDDLDRFIARRVDRR
jgi:8-oxo-dGTP pyrophosphatase MutT (NUDIX family)